MDAWEEIRIKEIKWRSYYDEEGALCRVADWPFPWDGRLICTYTGDNQGGVHHVLKFEKWSGEIEAIGIFKAFPSKTAEQWIKAKELV